MTAKAGAEIVWNVRGVQHGSSAGAQLADLVDELSDHACAHRRLTAEVGCAVQRIETVIGQAGHAAL
jgi:hypothetical protein